VRVWTKRDPAPRDTGFQPVLAMQEEENGGYLTTNATSTGWKPVSRECNYAAQFLRDRRKNCLTARSSV
jgi:hypothetical protein